MRSAALVLCCSTAVALAPANYQILRRAKVLRRAVEPNPRTVDGRQSGRAKEPAPAREAAGKAFGFVPPLTINKWEAMQAKRLRLEVLYSRDVHVDGDEFEGLRKAYLRTKRASTSASALSTGRSCARARRGGRRRPTTGSRPSTTTTTTSTRASSCPTSEDARVCAIMHRRWRWRTDAGRGLGESRASSGAGDGSRTKSMKTNSRGTSSVRPLGDLPQGELP